MISTGSSNRTMYLSPGEWLGQSVWVHELLWDEDGPSDGHHQLEWMTYFGAPTGGLWCPHCCGVVSSRTFVDEALDAALIDAWERTDEENGQ